MPELAEVEYNRKQWNCGLKKQVRAVSLHGHTRLFRQEPVKLLQERLPGSTLLRSEARGKQMLFEFSPGLWLGIHLGMTGALRVDAGDFTPGKHDHLVLYQDAQALIFTDPRQFGRVRIHDGPAAPGWWEAIPPSLSSDAFTLEVMKQFLGRHARLPLKAALLLQSGFPGVGNWMADEILWRAGFNPQQPVGRLAEAQLAVLWRKVRFVCQHALRHIGPTYTELPKGWFFHERWSRAGQCPRHGTPLRRAVVGGRTTAWCPQCQPGPRKPAKDR